MVGLHVVYYKIIQFFPVQDFFDLLQVVGVGTEFYAVYKGRLGIIYKV